MQKSIYKISKMDCPSEESMIRMKLDNLSNIHNLEFDIPNRTLYVYHTHEIEPITSAILDLSLGGAFLSSSDTEETIKKENTTQKKLLWAVLAINFFFFIIEMSTGIISKSMGLVADSLDMLADSFVYGMSLFAVGGSLLLKKNVAKAAGYLQITLALIGFAEVIRRFISNEELPDFSTMIVVSALALMANASCLYLLQKSKSNEAHMQASMIFTSNDIIINAGVIIAGILVNVLQSGHPDLIIGAIVFLLVIRGAFRIFKLSK